MHSLNPVPPIYKWGGMGGVFKILSNGWVEKISILMGGVDLATMGGGVDLKLGGVGSLFQINFRATKDAKQNFQLEYCCL